MTAPNRNTLWARTLADELARHGVRHVAVGSGSRSAPLVEAFVKDGRFEVHPHVDERSAGFFALGVAGATQRPAAVVTTSGTATANLLPAVIEASQSDIPLLVLTADRPAHLRGFDANQTIDQVRLYGTYPRETIDLALPRPRAEDLGRLRVEMARAVAASTGVTGPAGPVHINVQFEKPLEPSVVDGDVVPDAEAPGVAGRPEGAPFTSLVGNDGDVGLASRTLADLLRAATRPLIVCGPTIDPDTGPAALACAASAGAVVLADPLSGARFADGAGGLAVAHSDAVAADAVLDGAEALLRPDLIVRVGPAPTSAVTQRLLERFAGVDQVVIDRGRRWKDHAGLATRYLHTDPALTLSAAAGLVPQGESSTDAGWRAAWRAAGDAAAEALAPFLDASAEMFEGSVAAAVARGVPTGGRLFIGNSMPIRDVDAFAAPSDRPVSTLGFRGASGIDGNVSGALGSRAATGVPTLALIGDLTLLHDVGALLMAGGTAAAMQIVVIQNRGGGIFHMLPIRDYDPPFTRHVVMPHDIDIAAVAGAAGIPHSLSASIGELEAELEAGWQAGGLRILEVPIERDANWTRRRSALEAASVAVAGRLAAS